MKTVELAPDKDLTKLLKKFSKASGLSYQESAEKAFAEGLGLALEIKMSWAERASREKGLESELMQVTRRMHELRSEFSSIDTAYAVANFEAFEAFNAVGGMLMLYNVFRADVVSLSKEARNRGLTLDIDLRSTDVTNISELLDRYLFRRERATEERSQGRTE